MEASSSNSKPFWKFTSWMRTLGPSALGCFTEAKTSNKHLDARIMQVSRSTAELSCFKNGNWKLCSFAPVSLFHQMVGKGYPVRFTLYSYHMHGGPANPCLPFVEEYLLTYPYLWPKCWQMAEICLQILWWQYRPSTITSNLLHQGKKLLSYKNLNKGTKLL